MNNLQYGAEVIKSMPANPYNLFKVYFTNGQFIYFVMYLQENEDHEYFSKKTNAFKRFANQSINSFYLFIRRSPHAFRRL